MQALLIAAALFGPQAAALPAAPDAQVEHIRATPTTRVTSLALIEALRRSALTNYIPPGNSWSFATSQGRCKAGVRNESNCRSFIVPRQDLGVNAGHTYDYCPQLWERSGWGTFVRNSELVYWLEPAEAAPPTYSPFCG
ncbi:hypothetical protein N658DRAFT_500703 [Parathielavia hyrcaniae]|uniref:Uncharacterized protein n=1 Tax=Parathielavia hyrcaniae TaxID=113614 RepID=A0AAN6PSN8_9PEZI|nr:hypothetical protein N658DRAFT_500703 [Parathielavia hyrcaniae]